MEELERPHRAVHVGQNCRCKSVSLSIAEQMIVSTLNVQTPVVEPQTKKEFAEAMETYYKKVCVVF